MNINNFESIIDGKILDRGFDYYENDLVSELEQIADGEFSATVFGNEPYTLFIKLDNENTIIEHQCTCPYDWGLFCKHLVAVLYYLKDSQLYQVPFTSSTISKIEEFLTNCDKNEIINILIETMKRNSIFKEEIIAQLKR